MSVTYKALTIAGSDSGGGAGIQADLKTFQMLGVFGTSAITAVTAQNTLGVHGIYDIPLEGIEKQIDAVFTDIGVDAAKTGMLSQPEVIELVASKVKGYKLSKLVVDPVMIAKGGASLLASTAQDALRTKLLPLAAVVTPNIPEAEVITGLSIHSVDEMKAAAVRLVRELGAKAAVVKGGHSDGAPTDVLYDGERFELLTAERYETRHTHGTGCTFSAAITSELAKGKPLLEAVHTAKRFITLAIRYELGIGAGHGPTNHWAYHRAQSQEQTS
ncbi:bifunctional hydroxymethylpyrimidine kinase/phosphomethylpyrimidine kinase [Paenibacillus sp. GD4]|jgi:hydroxymethylpyrimidine/phosphomethylpyrimidine kinase|uniref:bifunctional hydroxymethylpyrimidine kinase/phosphomethylpyrimidine kinase n=1 Tax=Paenibacillus sp. GD4 TaxID=3068890 RepID=UPI0027969913|nr:bifunctional hydroxymethylpyrimidine kinase/phosphomethylpyrimidine kinase [Paenibacillus sp. GD4]MDQ1909877.1 bifunctional hydroxymethylpyrimidine kinase/phosphomethylpyrimidine kinase [Paenibacillus sp. GD4]